MFSKKPATLAATTQPLDLPTVAELAPRIANELEPKLLALGLERASLLDELRDLSQASAPDEAAVDHARELRIAEMTGLIPPQQPKPARKDRLSEARQRVADIDGALEILRREVRTERNRAGAIIRERLVPTHRKLVADLARTLIVAHQAGAALWNLVDGLESDGVSPGTMANQRPFFLGSPRNNNSVLAQYLKELIRDGFLPAKEMPEELKS
jgi:hypothetical protein